MLRVSKSAFTQPVNQLAPITRTASRRLQHPSLNFISFFPSFKAFRQATSALAGAAQGKQEQKDRDGCGAVAERCACPCRSDERSDKPTDHRRPLFQLSNRA